MRRYWAAPALLALIVISAGALAPPPAEAGGTVVVADDELSSAECAVGIRAPFEGFDAGARVLGCLEGAARDYLLAADRTEIAKDSYACFYLAPQGYSNGGPCLSLRTPSEHGPDSPLTGAGAPLVMGIGRQPGAGLVHIWGVASPATTSVTLESPQSPRAPMPANLLPTRIDGEGEPFVAFVAELPPADTCERLVVSARDGAGEPLGSDRVSRSDRAYPSAPLALPGAPDCEVEQAPAATLAALTAALRAVALGLVLA